MEIKRDLYLKKLIDRQQTKMRIYAKKVSRLFRCSNNSSYFCKQKFRIYAEKVNDDGDKARYSSEETH